MKTEENENKSGIIKSELLEGQSREMSNIKTIFDSSKELTSVKQN